MEIWTLKQFETLFPSSCLPLLFLSHPGHLSTFLPPSILEASMSQNRSEQEGIWETPIQDFHFKDEGTVLFI